MKKEDSLKYALHSLAVEGMILDEEELKLVKLIIEGKITLQEAIKKFIDENKVNEDGEFYKVNKSLYCYENSNILVNKLKIRDKDILEKCERIITTLKLQSVCECKVANCFSSEHLKEIHRFLFEDIYDFAGEYRTENIAKGNFRFAQFEYIVEQIEKLLSALKKENYLKDLNKVDLASRLAFYMSEFNVIHPFREGNGRTIREFIRQLAQYNGYCLDYSRISENEILSASIKSVVDCKELEEIIYKCLSLEE